MHALWWKDDGQEALHDGRDNQGIRLLPRLQVGGGRMTKPKCYQNSVVDAWDCQKCKYRRPCWNYYKRLEKKAHEEMEVAEK